MKLIIRWLIVALAVAAAAWLVPGIQVTGTNGVITVIVMALVLGLVNAIIRPLLVLLSCGCIVATFGLFMLVINAVTFWLASWITSQGFNLGFSVDNLWAAFLGSLVVSVVSFVLSMILVDDKR
ncbi:MAG TPA: phage holin family protein, partial [Anaerolineales bacterium]|nr:phage holin family protein [Anaerolineales bacterium]